jgi:hypothetical protein
MKDYLGESVVDKSETEYKDYTPSDFAVLYINMYGYIDGEHHKTWVLDQVARILKGTPVIIKLAKWRNGHTEYRLDTGKVSEKYIEYCIELIGEYFEGNDHMGIAP